MEDERSRPGDRERRMPDENAINLRGSAQQAPVCSRCGLRTIDLRASFMHPGNGKTIRIYKCECGKLVWDPANVVGRL